MHPIPIHKMSERTDIGLDVHYIENDEINTKSDTMGIHRDDHYIFFIFEGGHGSLMIDFNEITLVGGDVYYILPGQVHHRIRSFGAKGWFVAVDTMLVPQEYRQVFESYIILQQPYRFNEAAYHQYLNLVKLLHQQFNNVPDTPLYTNLLHAYLNSFIGFIACGYSKGNSTLNLSTRPYQITQGFKTLLPEHIKNEKRPTWYASKLNITEAYLNECLKKVTGFSVTYWILQEVMLEAKRLLYYTELNVKEIAHTLGYDDHTYFSRIFKKATDSTPLTFRDTYRK